MNILYWGSLVPSLTSNVFAANVRLVGGRGSFEGRVEVRRPDTDQWGLVCDKGWTLADANVVCRELGYSMESEWGDSGMPFVMSNVACGGDEASLADCSHNGWGKHKCENQKTAGVECRQVRANVRLLGSPVQHIGRVKARRNDNSSSWYHVCDDGFTDQEARVVCRSLGYIPFTLFSSGAVRAIHGSKFGSAFGTNFLMDDVNCNGNERRLTECLHSGWYSHNCGNNEAAAVVCSVARLVGGTSNSGRVEIVRPDTHQWGYVCRDKFDYYDARVVCRSLGFRTVSTIYVTGEKDPSQLSYATNNVHCNGNEYDLNDCKHDGFGEETCPKNEAVGVKCIGTLW